MNKQDVIWHFIEQYREEKGVSTVNMRDVVRYAVSKGYNLPRPLDPEDRAVTEFSQYARQQTRIDKHSRQEYRVNHMYHETQEGHTISMWVDIDAPDATRDRIHRSSVLRRNQMIDDGHQLTIDLNHWNSAHAREEPIHADMDLTLDVAERMAGEDKDQAS